MACVFAASHVIPRIWQQCASTDIGTNLSDCILHALVAGSKRLFSCCAPGTISQQAGCLLDLALRLLATWAAAEQTAAAGGWLVMLLRDAATLPPSAAGNF